ncbi:MAG: CHAT domain-containing protein [Cuspidothrix sp.]
MPALKLTLTATNNQHFTIVAGDYATENSALPFFDVQGNSHLRTVINTLNVFTTEYLSNNNDQNWMISEGLLNQQNPKFFHSQMRENIGKKLYQALFTGNIEEALNKERGKNENLHIQIQYDFRVSATSNLSLYPWHLAHNGKNFLAKDGVTFFYRILDNTNLPRATRQIDKLKILVISSQAFDDDQSQLQNQAPLINDSLNTAQNEGRACLLSWYQQNEKPTFTRLRDYLTDHFKQADKLPDIIHFNGHGVFKDKSGFLQLENDDQDNSDYISAEDFKDLIEICNPKPQLVVITACQGSLAHKSDSVFNGVAQKLLQIVPAVVATPFTISQDSTTDFIGQFYRLLGTGKSSLLEAVKFASKAMKYKEYEWYRFVVFLRHDGDEDGYLFDFQETPLQPVISQNRELEASDIEIMKDLLKRCRIITTNRIIRENFCKSIGIEIDDISPDGLASLSDKLFIDTLLDYLERTDNISAFYQLCIKLEPHFKSSLTFANKLQVIKNKFM